MISIQEHNHLGKPNPKDFLLLLANRHLEELMKTKNTMPLTYRAGSIAYNVKKYKDRADAFETNYVKNYANSDVKIAHAQSGFFDYLFAKNYEKVKKIIVGNPDELELIRQQINDAFGLNLFFDATAGMQTEFGQLMSNKIFNYKKFRDSAFCATQMAKMGFEHARCPYCGYMPVKVVKVNPAYTSDDKDRALLDLDHFFSKAQNPYLAVSFFNLIPCCHICNSTYKGTKVFELDTHVHPFRDSFDDYFEFTTKASSGIIPDTIQLNKRPGKVSKFTSHLDFKLEARYNTAKVELLQIELDYEKWWAKWKDTDVEAFKEFMLRHFPRSKCDVLRFEYAKAKRDILKNVDIGGVFTAF